MDEILTNRSETTIPTLLKTGNL